MNPHRVAALLLEQAELAQRQAAVSAALASEFGREANTTPEVQPSDPVRKRPGLRKARVVRPPPLDLEPSDLDVQRAKRALRRAGVNIR